MRKQGDNIVLSGFKLEIPQPFYTGSMYYTLSGIYDSTCEGKIFDIYNKCTFSFVMFTSTDFFAFLQISLLHVPLAEKF